MKKFQFALMAFVGLGLSSGVFASPTLCSDGDPNADGMSVSDVTWQGENADDCYGINQTGSGGNVSVDDANAAWGDGGLNTSFGPGNFTEVVKKEQGSDGMGSFAGLDFTLEADIGENGQGTPADWALSWVCNGNCPATIDVVVGLKASNRNGLWLLDDTLFDDQGGDSGTGAGTFVINFDNNGSSNPGLSNMVLLMREGTAVSEPGSLALLSLGLLGLYAGRKATSRNDS